MPPSDNNKYGSTIMSDADYEAMMADVERKEVASAKRRATLAAKKAKAEAERLARPPIDVNDAFWRAVEAAVPKDTTPIEKRRKVIKEMKVEFEGTTWTRHSVGQSSNSGKTISDWTVTYHGADGRVVEWQTAVKNRRNDPDRNWGAGRD